MSSTVVVTSKTQSGATLTHISLIGGDIGLSVEAETLGLGVDLKQLAEWLEPLLASAKFRNAGGVAVELVSDREMASLNRQFRGVEGSTDVLSFPGGASTAPDSGMPMPHLGDLAISLATADRQAMHEGHTLETELKYLVLHGLLHCLGYDHEADQGEMDELELVLRARWLPVQEGVERE